MCAKRRLIRVLVVCLSAGVACAEIDGPSVTNWQGTAYREGGWFSYVLKTPYADGAVKFDNKDAFLLSPRYAAPIRKVIIRAKPSSANPARVLTLIPFLAGEEAGTGLGVPEGAEDTDGYLIYSFDFQPSENADAFRLCLTGGGSGNWAVSDVCVFHGEPTPDEDERLRAFAAMLPTPQNPRVTDFSASSLALAVDPVVDAANYRFEIERMTGTPLTTVREDFIDGSELDEGWTYGAVVNAKLGTYTGATTPDNKTKAEGDSGICLKIEAGSGAEDVQLEILSPLLPADAIECSFVSKRSSGTPCDDAVSVYGRTGTAAEWVALADPLAISTSKTWTTNALDRTLGIRQLKFVVSGSVTDWANCAIDTLRVVYGGDETLVPVSVVTNAQPSAALSDLATASYLYRAQALGDGLRDSSWTEKQLIDLSWVDKPVAAPDGVQFAFAGGMPTVSWNAAEGADHYLVDVLTAGYPPETIVSGHRANGTTVALDEIDAPGEFVVRVTAVAPGGKRTATSSDVPVTVSLGAVSGVTVTAKDAATIEATWPAVPLAESYRVRLIEIGGASTRIETKPSALAAGWPSDWAYHAEWTEPTLVSGNLKMAFKGAWFVPPTFPDSVTEIRCALRSGSSSAAVLETQSLCVEVSPSTEGDADWQVVSELRPTELVTNITLRVAYADGARRVRFRAASTSDMTPPNVQLGAFTITCGERTRAVVRTRTVASTGETFGELSSDGCYVVEVAPQPSADAALAAESDEVDLSVMKPREVEPVSLRRCLTGEGAGVYSEDFSSLASIRATIATRELSLPHWQFFSGGEGQTKLGYTKTGASTAAGVFVVSDTNRTEASYLLATHTTGTSDALTGLAFQNDGSFRVVLPEVAFDAVQRSFQREAKSQVVEWLVTNALVGVDAPGDWRAVDLGALTAPLTVETRAGDVTEHRQRLSAELVGAEVAPGEFLLLRWRDPARASSPMMGLDDVSLSYLTMLETGGVMFLQ